MSNLDTYAHDGGMEFKGHSRGAGVYERPLAPRLHAHLGLFLELLGLALAAFAVFAIHTGT